MFLEKKGYDVTSVSSGLDALEQIKNHYFDIAFLDENMPGMSGLQTLSSIKLTHPNLPVVMITQNEAEEVMEEALGAKIADYLTKPINPSQVLLSIKRILDNKRIVSERTNLSYQHEFHQLGMNVMEAMNHYHWQELYKKLTYWELQIDETEDRSMVEVFHAQKAEADAHFSDFLMANYEEWITHPNADYPVLSHQLLKKKVFDKIGGVPVFLIIIDNLRYDQWKVIEPEIMDIFSVASEDSYYSILPTATAYSRNALFGGMLPLEISRKYPDLWTGENPDEGKNNFEKELLEVNLARNKMKIKFSYHKILQADEGKQLVENIQNLMTNGLNAIVFNFVDMLSHARTDMQMIRELAPDESAYRYLTKAWFIHSPLRDLLKSLANHRVKVMLTTDHGTIRVNKPYRIAGDKHTNTNLRYKVGRNLSFDGKGVYFSREPEKIGLPRTHLSTTYVFAKDNCFFVYPNKYHHYVRLYEDSFQHGGISMEEVIIPFITLSAK